MALTLWLIAINAVTFIAFGVDKWKAEQHMWRIPEATLLALAAAGGSIGALAGMKYFRHKTLKPKFRIGIPAILAAQVLLLSGSGADVNQLLRILQQIR